MGAARLSRLKKRKGAPDERRDRGGAISWDELIARLTSKGGRLRNENGRELRKTERASSL